MPVYEYVCIECATRFSHLWKTMSAATSCAAPPCPDCGAAAPRRVISQTTVLNQMGGLTPQETEQVKAVEERAASFTPKSQIEALQSNRAPSETL